MLSLRNRTLQIMVFMILMCFAPLNAIHAEPPADFNLTYPAHTGNYGSAALPFPLTLTWEPSTNASNYTVRLVLGSSIEGEPVFVDNAVTSDTFYTLTLPQQSQLAPGQILSWSVTATNDTTGENLTKTANFSVDFSPAPQDFTLTTPANNSNAPLTDPFTLTWAASPNATGYIFNLNGVVQDATTTQTSYTLTAEQLGQLQIGQTYSWSVAATNGYFGDNVVRNGSFTVDPPPSAPQDFNLTYPAHQVQYPSATLPFPLTFTWEPSANATSYIFRLTTGTFVEQTAIVDNAVTTDTFFILTADQQSQLIPGSLTQWSVTASNGESAHNRTKTAELFLYPSDAPGSFNLLAPTENSSYTAATLPNPLTFTWEAAPNATGYIFNLNGVVQNLMTTQTSYTLSQAERNMLLGSGSFEWSVAASNGTFYQNVMRYGHFNITPSPAPQTFTQLTPADGSTFTTATLPDAFTFTWSASTNAIGYYFALSDGVVIVPQTFTTQTSYTLSADERAALVPNHTYYWLVKATNGNPAQDLTLDAGFTLIPAPPEDFNLTYPAPGGTYLPATLPFPMTFTWEPSANATTYTFRLIREIGPGLDPVVIVDNVVTAATSYTLTADQQANFTYPHWQYVWTVTASNSESPVVVTKTGSYYLDTSSPDPSGFSLLAPAENSSFALPTLPDPFTFFWEASPNATGYIFNLNGIVHNLMTTQTSYTLSQAERLQLQSIGSYEWSVTATNGFFYQNVIQPGHFNVTPALEDAIENAHAISSVPFSYSADTSGTTTALSDPNPACLSPDQVATSVWFRLDAAYDETVIFDTSTSDYDTVINVYSGSDPLNLNLMECRHLPSSVRVTVSAGQAYYVMVNRKVNTSEGVLRITVNPAINPPTLTSPANGATHVGNPPTLYWDAVPGATGYNIVLEAVDLGTSATYYTENSVGMVLPDTLLETTYSWRVMAINDVPGINGISRYGEAQIFTITSLPSDVPSLNLTYSIRPELTWSVIEWAVMYRLEVATTRSFGSSIIFTTTTSNNNNSDAPIIDFVPGLYYWRVCALAAGQTTCKSWSPTQTLTIGR